MINIFFLLVLCEKNPLFHRIQFKKLWRWYMGKICYFPSTAVLFCFCWSTVFIFRSARRCQVKVGHWWKSLWCESTVAWHFRTFPLYAAKLCPVIRHYSPRFKKEKLSNGTLLYLWSTTLNSGSESAQLCPFRHATFLLSSDSKQAKRQWDVSSLFVFHSCQHPAAWDRSAITHSSGQGLL